MTAIAQGVHRAEALHGVRQIFRFNWPSYAVGITVALAAPVVISQLPLGLTTSAVLYAAAGVVWLWVGGSLAASWLVYDRSNLMTGEWILPALGFRPAAWINVHAGLDETSAVLRALLGPSGRVLDIFDPTVMTEPSIARARTAATASGSADFRRLPVASGTVEAALLLLSAHELRSEDARTALFREINRVLTRGGKAVVAEHLRDLPNLAAFGPGFLHFHSRSSWIRCFRASGFSICDELPITPFVRVFILGRSHDAHR